MLPFRLASTYQYLIKNKKNNYMRLARRRLRPKFNKSPLDIMMGMIVFVLFRSVSGSEETVGTVLQANKTSCFGFIHTSILVSSAFLQKNPFIASSNPCGISKGNSHHTFSFFVRRQCKGRVRVPKRMIFWKRSKEGGGSFSIQKFIL